MDVRVDPGPQDGTVLVTWIPVTVQPLQHVDEEILLFLFTSVLTVSPAAAERDGGRREGEDQPSHGVRSLRRRQEGHRRGLALQWVDMRI